MSSAEVPPVVVMSLSAAASSLMSFPRPHSP
jgi:hypothetical protein